MTSVIDIERLGKRYGDAWAVQDVSFQVNEGEIFGILGANGAGKTTTVECLQGLRTPTQGSLKVLGHDPTAAGSGLRSRVGSQLQDAALPDRIRVTEALDLFGTNGAGTADVLERWGLEPHRRKAFADLSGGLRQRLFIALALLNDPDVVFFDELTQGLDPLARREVWDAIAQVRAAGTTVVLVTHFMDEAEALCDRLAVFAEGRMIAEGTPAEIIERHADTASMTFTPPEGLAGIELCPGVRHITNEGHRLNVEGHPTMVAHVCAALVAAGPVPTDLRIHQPDLEDAILAIENGDHR